VTTGILGGAFDPPHEGHVALGEAAKARFGLARLLVLVTTAPGHKGVVAAAEVRLELARAAFPGVQVELDPHARTVDMLRERRLDDALFVVGADEFCDFLEWKEPDAVLGLARLGVAARPGYPHQRIDRVLKRLQRPDRVTFFELQPHDVSSSDIRARAGHGEPIDGLVPPPVAALIHEHSLYRSGPGLH
jgi:nicotinate-nucleotide adenylyltransferase